MHRLLHAGLLRALADGRADAIILAIGDHGPAVVDAGPHQIQFIAALRAMLDCPDFTGFWVHGNALDIAIAIGVNLGPRPGPAREGVVFGHGTIGVDAYQRAGMIGQILRARPIAPVACCDKQCAIIAKQQTRAKMPAAARLGHEPEDDPHISQPVIKQPGPRDLGAETGLVRAGIADIDR